MEFVYHGAPREMVGDVLYPLDQLAAVHPGLYAVQKSKYDGREQVMPFQVPHLNRGFTDHRPLRTDPPLSVQRAVGSRARPAAPTGGNSLQRLVLRDPARADPWVLRRLVPVGDAVDQRRAGEDVPLAPPADEFEPFDALRYRRLSSVPSAHLDYLRRMNARGERGLLFVHVPHVLVAGPIDVSGLRPIAWDEPPASPLR